MQQAAFYVADMLQKTNLIYEMQMNVVLVSNGQ